MAEKVQDRTGEQVSGASAEVSAALTLGGAVEGLQSFSDGYGENTTDIPLVLSVGNTWQTGKGSYDHAAQTVTFTELHDSSNGGAAISMGDGAELRVAAVADIYNAMVGGGPTNLGHILAPATVEITSSTGTSTTIPPAQTGQAGVMSGAQVDDLASKIGDAPNDGNQYARQNLSWQEVVAAALSFLGLTDTPSDYTGQQGKLIKVNATEDGLIFGDPSGTTVSWGDIIGTLSNQTDLQAALDGKEPVISPKNSAFNVNFGTGAGDACQGNDGRLSDSRDPNPHTHTESEITDLKSYLQAVADDDTPKLGGSLDARTFDITFANTAETEIIGALGPLSDDTGIFIGKLDAGEFNPTDGGLALKAGRLESYGTVNYLEQFVGASNQQVYVDNGILYAVNPPAPGWTHVDTDIGVYSLTTLNAWVELTGLVAVVQEDVADGERLDITVSVFITNLSSRDGTVDLGFGLGVGVEPTSGQNYVIPAGFVGYIVNSFSTTTHGGLSASDQISVWARRFSQSNPQFDPIADGSAGNDHEVILSVPAEGGGGTDLSNAVFPDSAHFSSEKVADATVAFNDGNKQTVDAATHAALTLSAPGVGSYILQITNSGSLTSITPPPLWDGGQAPTWGGTSILALYFDGTNWYGSAMVSAA